MKIEKLNDNQIRCTLNKRDLIDRELKISELAYGSEKAKGLFRDMMNQAFDEFGFEADDIPLVIEAIPISGDCIVLIVTKVEDPEELDTRFAKFSPMIEDDSDEDVSDNEDISYSSSEDEYHSAEDILNLIKKISDGISGDNEELQEHIVPISERAKKALERAQKAKAQKSVSPKIFSFATLDEAALAAHVIYPSFDGQSTLYKNIHGRRYFLVLCSDSENFTKVANTVSEFGKREKAAAATLAYYSEHYEVLIRDNAVKILSEL